MHRGVYRVYLVRPVTVTHIAELLLNAGLGMEASPTLHLKSVMAAVPEFATRVAEIVMLRCDTTLLMEPNTGVVAMSATGVKAVQTELCTIADVFGKLQGITTDVACRSGCATGTCPPGWMPTAADECSPECGRVFEPFCAIALSLN